MRCRRNVYRFICATISAGMLSGCGPKDGPATGQQGGPPPTFEVKSPPATTKPAESKSAGLPTTLTHTFKGRTAEYWGKLLFDADPFTAGDGVVGVGNCGEEGLRFAADAMRSDSRDVRYNGARAVSGVGAKYEKDLLPLLTAMLSQPESGEWDAAADAITTCDFFAGEMAIREAAERAKETKRKSLLVRTADGLSKRK